MKVIDLLNKVAEGEEVPEKIIYKGDVYTYNKDMEDYEDEVIKNEDYKYLFENPYGRRTSNFLNDEIEIKEKEDGFTGIKFYTNGKEYASFKLKN